MNLKNLLLLMKAYKKNDLLTLFIYSYENNFYNKENITYELFTYLNNEIDKKEKNKMKLKVNHIGNGLIQMMIWKKN